MKIITVLLTNHFAALHAAGLIFLIVAFQVAVARLELQREAKRRWQHALTGQALVLISYFLPIAVALPALLVGAFGIWYCRLYLSDIYFRAFGPLLRPNERLGATLPGAFYFLVGTFLAVLLFPLPVARYAVLCLSWADPMAAWIGQTIPILSIHRSASLGDAAHVLSLLHWSDTYRSRTSTITHEFSPVLSVVLWPKRYR